MGSEKEGSDRGHHKWVAEAGPGSGSEAWGQGSPLAAFPSLASAPWLQSCEAVCVPTPSFTVIVPICLAGCLCWDIARLPSIMSQ